MLNSNAKTFNRLQDKTIMQLGTEQQQQQQHKQKNPTAVLLYTYSRE